MTPQAVPSTPYAFRLRKEDWEVRAVALRVAQDLVRAHHYAKGGSNTGVATHGLFRKGRDVCEGVAWWLPPTKPAAVATYPQGDWRGVLSLTRLVVAPGVPKNACTFMLARSMKMLDRDKWPCLVTYADTWRGHQGTIYKACNWAHVGQTKPEAVWVLDGRMVARKSGPKTRTNDEMRALGAELQGRFCKEKFVHVARL